MDKWLSRWGTLHTHNPSYSGGRQRDHKFDAHSDKVNESPCQRSNQINKHKELGHGSHDEVLP
jgi:hypothetical protein